MRLRAIDAVVGLLLLTVPATAAAQEHLKISRGKLIAVNVLIGGAVGGVGEVINGRSFWRGFLSGSAGGATVFAGKCMLAQQTPATNWLGRATVAAGSSMVANASGGRPVLSRFIIPVGPLRLYRDNRTRKTTVKLDIQQIAVATYMEMQPSTSLDLTLSRKAGGLVFFDRSTESAVEVSGVIRVWSKTIGSTFAHELTHVAQGEFVAIALEEPLERWLMMQIPGGKAVNRYVDIGILSPVWAGLNELLATRERPWEKEAGSFAVRC
jgi:hypothetical protein